MAAIKSRWHRGIKGAGPFIYTDFLDNHVVWPAGEGRLNAFLGQTFKHINHKRIHARSSNSEDALTWSCFDILDNASQGCRAEALGELWELVYGEMAAPNGFNQYRQDLRHWRKYYRS